MENARSVRCSSGTEMSPAIPPTRSAGEQLRWISELAEAEPIFPPVSAPGAVAPSAVRSIDGTCAGPDAECRRVGECSFIPADVEFVTSGVEFSVGVRPEAEARRRRCRRPESQSVDEARRRLTTSPDCRRCLSPSNPEPVTLTVSGGSPLYLRSLLVGGRFDGRIQEPPVGPRLLSSPALGRLVHAAHGDASRARCSSTRT